MLFHKNELAFTLIELLVVCAIIGLLSAVIIPSIMQSRARGRDSEVKAQVQTIKLALARASQTNPSGAYPGTISPTTWYCLKLSGTCANGNISADSTFNTAVLPYFPGGVFPQPQGTLVGQMRYDAYSYTPYWPPSWDPTGYGGPTLVWAQEKVIQPADCNGKVVAGTGADAGISYCYERLQ